MREKRLTVDAFEFDLAVLEGLQKIVLFLVGQIGETFALIFRLAILIERGESIAVGRGRPLRGLRALLLRAVHEWRLIVVAFGAAIGSGKLSIDEHGTTGIFPAGRLGIGRNDAVRKRLDRARFIGGEVMPWARPHRGRGIAGIWRPRQFA